MELGDLESGVGKLCLLGHLFCTSCELKILLTFLMI